ncbi:helicase C-terminal domain-containing protein [Blakeslea trispora]|nr:helicase C-terminal domain-containing protein [Blakeslea trispora]
MSNSFDWSAYTSKLNGDNVIEKKQKKVHAPGSGQTITIESVRIDFPLKPYAAQIQMMNKIIRALNRSENALLESPTGSGKSLALLCAALAWREHQKKKIDTKVEDTNLIESSKRPIEVDQENDRVKKIKTVIHQENEDDDFQPIRQTIPRPKESEPSDEDDSEEEEEEYIRLETEQKKAANTKIPKIFVGSRTHKQITQLVQELRNNTSYSARTTILGSREQFCIHPKVSKSTTKNDDCTRLLDENSCSYFHKARKLVARATSEAIEPIWDIEDLVRLGQTVRGCPYFASRKMYEFAEVVFCPYNYIIDPVIRKALDIQLKDNIVILDEAHNIEDASRSAGSFEMDENTVDILLKELDLVATFGGEKEAHRTIGMVIHNLKEFFTDEATEYTVKEYEKQSGYWTGTDMMQKLNQVNISAITFQERLLPAYKAIVSHADFIRKEKEGKTKGAVVHLDPVEGEEGPRPVRLQCLSHGSLHIVQGLFTVLGLLCDPNHRYAEDYQLVLTKTLERPSAPKRRRRRQPEATESRPQWVHRMAFWCLNPGVIFNRMSQDTRSVILTSGTLSPLSTFASELDTQFSGQLEANHVIKPSQVWVGSIPQGPHHIPLKGVYQNLESFGYQDEVGATLLEIVQTVPYGVLCFLPSYKALDLLIDRWKLTGILDKMKQVKMVLSEPRGGDKKEFEIVLNSFYHQIDLAEQQQEGVGALMFAVFRGKVSEGIDFSDNYCRAVVTLGIPYPGVKDLEVKLKRDYNNRRRGVRKDLLTGQEWYTAQAYRAINQALGRCIRHRNDWGAIILLEERFNQPEVVHGLSKWVKGQFRVHSNYTGAMMDLKRFIAEQQQDSEPKKIVQEEKTSIVLEEKASTLEEKMSVVLEEKEAEEIAPVTYVIDPPLPLPMIEDGSSMDIVDTPQKDLTIHCKYCHGQLMEGSSSQLEDVYDTQLQCLQDRPDQPKVIQLIQPAHWTFESNRLLGGPLDIDQLPVCAPVLYNRRDQVCYRLLACVCDQLRPIGMVICLATSIHNDHHLGCVYLWENKVSVKKQLPPVPAIEASQQPSYMTDMFYDL